MTLPRCRLNWVRVNYVMTISSMSRVNRSDFVV